MKRISLFVFVFFALFQTIVAQNNGNRDHDHSHEHSHSNPPLSKDRDKGIISLAGDSLIPITDSLFLKPLIKKPKDVFHDSLPNTYTWKINQRLGDRTLVYRDTSFIDFHQRSLVDGRDVTVGYLSNIGSAARSNVYFDRPETSRFIFLDNFSYWHKNPGDNLFYNTKVPYSNIYYQSGGGGETQEQRLMTELTSNFGKKINVGFNFDYLYARGYYTGMFNKQINYDLYGSYIGDKYKMQAFVSNNNFTNSANGGITDDKYITNPESMKDQFDGSSLNIPVRYQNTWNKMHGRNIYVTNRYDIGDDTELYALNDSTQVRRKKPGYVSPASVIFTSYYTDQLRRVHSRDATELTEWYVDTGLANVDQNDVYTSALDDQMAYWSFKNTFALAMNEGFRSWTKFGLTAFIESDIRKYALTEVSLLPHARSVHSENSFTIGAVLSKEQGENLQFTLSAEKNLSAEDYKVEGAVTGRVKLFGKNVSAKANAYIKSLQPTFFENKFGSKYFYWDKSLSNTRKVYIGGEITLPSFSFSQTKISGGVENVENAIYYAPTRIIEQSSKNIQVVSLRLDQKLKAGLFHWDSQIVYQMTGDDEVIPLPDLSFYTNVYIEGKIAKVLSFQLGMDAHFFTKYYLPGYEPMTMQFYNQREKEIGNFPISTAYLNLNLKNTRFFIMMYNVLDGIGNGESFTTLHYPVNPRILKLGLSWNFNN